jgi:predicted nucleic acid-binding protein
MSLVLDSSFTLSWLYSDELTPVTQQIFDRVVFEGAWVLSLWRLEIASLHGAVRRKRISTEFCDAALTDLSLLNIMIDPDTDTFAWSATLRLAERGGLTVYDAAYLELAQRLAFPLATLDQELRAAASELGVILLGS